MPADAAARLREWKRKLLDLSKRNRLIHFKPTRVSTISIVDELPPEVFRSIALEGAAMSFLTRRVGDNPTPVDTTFHRALTPTEIVEHHLDRSLQTDLDKEPLDHSLLQIYRKATSIYEERGYNTLFLALGFLHWTESPAAPEVLRAPLLLLPVELSRASLRAPFRLRAREEDPILNPALVQRLKTDFGIELPPLPDTLEEIDPQAVFDGFARAIAGMDRWAVSNRIYLGLFSFMKFFMYKDLEVHGETFLKNAAVAWLAGEPDLLARTAKEIPAGAQLDRIPPEKSFQVLDADSSQQEVIEAAKQGHHMVIEGPPGTGKSQTITNLVAEFLNSGKTVLFVSEKMAALRVVYERLQRVGLGDFCMELHSQMTSKRQVMEDLGRTLNLPREAPSIDAASLARVGALRDELNAYVKELGEPVGGIAAAPFEMFGRLEALQTAPDAPVALRGTARWTAQKVQDLEGKVRSLSAAAERVHPVQDNPWRGARLTDAPYSRVVEIQAAIRALLAAHADHERLSSDLAAALETRDAANFGEAEALVDLARLLVESPRPDPAQLADARWDHPSPDLQEVLENGKSHDAAVEELRRRYTDGVLGIDAESMQAWWLVFGSGLFRWLRPTWWRIRSAFKLHRKPGAGTRPLEDLNLVVKAQLSKRRIEKFDGLAAFGSRWTGVDSPWGELQRLADWLVRFRSHVRSGLASARCLRLAASGLQGTDVGRVEGALRSLRHAWDDLSRLLDFGDPVPDLEPMRDRVEAMRDREAGLSDWARYCAARAGLAATEAAALVPHLAGLSPGQYEPTFQKQWVRSWLEEVLPARPLLAAFDGAEHDRRVASFRDLDRLQMEINRRRCRAGLLSKLPDAGWDASPGSELAILQREVRKKRRHLPIRKLFSEVPNCLRSVKPCLMMSPLSVAQFVEPRREPFDVVVFDEASQIAPEDAIGTIARGRQVIVVGDSKQLPPTPFFQVEIPEADIEAEDEATEADLESILDECATAFPCRRMLRWHYRSRHESLITFSNRAYYDGRLSTFPSPHDDGKRLGLEFVHVADGVYDRGKTGVNAVEAGRVAQAVFDYLKANPGKSVGVGAFSVKQQQGIQDSLEALRRRDGSLESHFDPSRAEYCFVKNLETIQGDERDVIFLSVGYGKDAQGRMSLNMGPLNQAGGGRRLNVLVTRAREKVFVFCSVRPEDIDISKTDSVGVRNLRLYLDYARRGGEVERTEDSARRAGFENGVAAALRSKGLTLREGVGNSGYRIDLAVVDSDGRAMLGVECDGSAYRSATTARDRDRLRGEVLQGLGWRLHRVWSVEWYRNRDRELGRVLQALERGSEKVSGILPRAPDASIAEPAVEELPPVLASEVMPYRMIRIRRLGSPEAFFEERIDRLAALLTEIVAFEGPVHEEEAARRVAAHWDISRMTAKVLEVVASAGRRMERAGLASRRGVFLWPPELSKPTLRRRLGPDAPCQAELIAPEEIAEAILLVLRKEFRVPEDALVGRAASILGFARSGPKVRESMLAALDLLRKTGTVEVADGALRLKSP